jgi:hypothetical protein
MNRTQYAIFEICMECNLGDIHAKCPNSHSDRYANLPHDKPVSDEQIVETVTALYRDHGFRGHVGWHYYNEPLVAAERMWRLMDMIDAQTNSEASYTLWTNGTLLPADCSQFARFAEIHVTNYRIKDHPVKNLRELVKVVPGTIVQRGRLDSRLHAIGDKVATTEPCSRMFTEFIIDYYGNVHLCCYDWKGQGSPGNIHTESLGDLIANWQWIRTLLAAPESVTPGGQLSCRRCKVRSPYIPEFIPAIAQAARRSVEELCHE